MQGRTSVNAPALPESDLRRLGAGLPDYYADLLEEPLPPAMRDALSRGRDVPHLLPGLLPWQQAPIGGERPLGHQPFMAL